jgi:hypothetical protein
VVRFWGQRLRTVMTTYQNVFFRPWIGEKYGGPCRFGMRLLVLGESHYEYNDQKLTPMFTIECVRKAATECKYDRFWTGIVSAFLGRSPSRSETAEFWSSVAFYDFVQESVGFGANKPPTPAMFRNAVPAFLEVLTLHRPKVIIVISERLWSWLPSKECGHLGPTLTVGSEHKDTWWYPIGANEFALASRIHHPSKRGTWDFNEWHTWVNAGIEAANRPEAPG